MRLLARTLAAVAIVATVPGAVRAEDKTTPVVLTTLHSPPPCGFFRSLAFGRGLDDPATEMLWACEAIAARRAADIPLGVRLEATEFALLRYRDALHAAARAGRSYASGHGPTSTYPSDTDKNAIADATGIAAALSAIASGY